jgi:hypothetical protein
MTYSVGNSEVANYANTSSGKVTNVVADDGVGGSGEAVNVVDRVQLSFVVATTIQFLTIDVTSLAGYVAGMTDVTVTVNAGVYVYGTPPTQQFPIPGFPNPTVRVTVPDASMQIIGGAEGDTIKLVNNGNIVGFGGDGGGVQRFVQCGCSGVLSVQDSDSLPGNAALSLITPGISVTIENNGYIAGGGGGGGKGSLLGSGVYTHTPGGGGGAGGGISGVIPTPGSGVGVSRAVPPNAGNNGVFTEEYYSPCGSCCTFALGFFSGGGGGFVLPGTGGVTINNSAQVFGRGGGAGGSGAVAASSINAWDNNGGGANNAAPTYTLYSSTQQGGGGGGWGASGAAGYSNLTLNQLGATGGNSIVTNGNAYTLTGSGQVYGSVNTATTSVVYTIPTSVETGTTLDLASIPGYTTGTNVVLIVPASVRLTSNSNATPALDITKSGTSNDPSSVRVVLNGAILGAGGDGGSETITAPNTSMNGGDALRLPNIGAPGVTWIIDNTNGDIAGGGGGGGRGQNNASLGSATAVTYGGGGAGLNGSSGVSGNAAYNAGVASGVASGTNGTNVVVGSVTYSSGGSGGTILPGTQTDNIGPFLNGVRYPGKGGTAGGSGALTISVASTPSVNNAGGGFQQGGGQASFTQMLGSGCAGGGGGGWGGAGGSGIRSNTTVSVGGIAGRAVAIQNSNTKVYVVNPTNLAGTIAT